jgi:hypothetical protein
MRGSKGLGKVTLAALLAGWFFLGATLPARAGLGGDAGSVESDALLTGGQLAPSDAPLAEAATAAPYQVKSFVTGSGVTVREYAAPSGAIFGVAWRGRRPPDLSVLLGAYYSEYLSASALKRHKDLRRAMIVGPNATVMLAGHMGLAFGRAFVSRLAPAGVNPQAVIK